MNTLTLYLLLLFHFPTLTHCGQCSHNISIQHVLIRIRSYQGNILPSRDTIRPLRIISAPFIRSTLILRFRRILVHT